MSIFKNYTAIKIKSPGYFENYSKLITTLKLKVTFGITHTQNPYMLNHQDRALL